MCIFTDDKEKKVKYAFHSLNNSGSDKDKSDAFGRSGRWEFPTQPSYHSIHPTSNRINAYVLVYLRFNLYPLDYCGNTYAQATKFFEKQMRVETLRYMALSDTFQKAKTSVFRTIIKYPLFMYSKAMGAGFFLRKLEKNINKINENDTQYCCSWCGTGGMPATKLVFPSEWFNELMEVQFEDQYYFIPKHYDEILSQVYGDYMSFPPVEEQVGHHYYVAYRK